MSELEYGGAGYRGQVTREIRAEQDQGPPTSCKQLGQAGVQGPAPTLTPGSGPSVTLFLPVQDVLLGEGVEAPPFLPASALPPAQAVAGVLAAVQGVPGCNRGGKSRVILGSPLLPTPFLERREVGEEHGLGW